MSFKTATDLFDLKIKKIQNLIRRIESDDQYKNFLNIYSDDDVLLSSILLKYWNSPLILPENIDQFLIQSFAKLVKKDTKHIRFIFEEPKKILYDDDFQLNYTTKSFEKSQNDFFELIFDDLPCGLAEILKDTLNDEQLFDRFKYLLHLIQKKKLYYDKETGIIRGAPLNE